MDDLRGEKTVFFIPCFIRIFYIKCKKISNEKITVLDSLRVNTFVECTVFIAPVGKK